jgi:hypothetical protein
LLVGWRYHLEVHGKEETQAVVLTLVDCTDRGEFSKDW